MSSILITGANKGLGREAARQLRGLGHDVWVGARDADRGREAADALGARFVQLDVTDDATVARAAEEVGAVTGGSLDVLVNNAGIPGTARPTPEVTAADVEEVFAVNVLGPVRVLHAFLPLLRRSSAGVVVNVSSGLGSHAVTSEPGRVESSFQAPAYTSSKAALNMLTSQWAAALPDLRVNCVDPGYTATEFNGNSGPQTVEEGAEVIVRMATVGIDGPTGTYSDRHGPLDW
ncbi:SDR family NAD(P)-dependent oxidoreductase [Pseudokineococcus lusitanus]|uniref:NAD(P)-dependent dehydrogenase (Short-subunit alcohol dehydrogenase family) n=1 Tax=Pseudokineococcus lusitanus TaxID=763993 RepID=A0A3N1HR38_9ACTN|nr:SDR family NAD(P)-dependent oxidoreductase [Pseudokineococcus lusitanus]ROP44973.1 NAD(P)-dependent dehydrogenase (short-subunit alcohol dehydrogenase family) [Pseudokineococcus lusitanus]